MCFKEITCLIRSFGDIMIIRSEDLKMLCTKILFAVDSNELSILTETLELETQGTYLLVSVTNKEYFVQVKLNLDETVNLHATVNANLFLKLIAQITTDTIELKTSSTSLIVIGNGTYNLPLIYENDKLLKLPNIVINNPTCEFSVSSEILNSIMLYNSRELLKGALSKPVQKMYYVDEHGAITFTSSGACVNGFTLEKPVKFLLPQRVVKLFKLFKDCDVRFTLGYDAVTQEIIQTKVQFETPDVRITSIVTVEDINTLIRSVPVNAIRGRADQMYRYSVTMNKEGLLQTINRLMLFNTVSNGKANIKPYSIFEFGSESVTIYDTNKINKEQVDYTNTSSGVPVGDVCSICLDLQDIKTTLESCSESYVTLSFEEESEAIVISRGLVRNVLSVVS